MSTLREAAQDALEMIESLLCDPEGRACVGSDGDCRIIDATKITLRAALAAEPAPLTDEQRAHISPAALRAYDRAQAQGQMFEPEPPPDPVQDVLL